MVGVRAYASTLAAVCLNLAIALPLCVILNIWQDDAYTLHSTGSGAASAFHAALSFEQSAPLYFVIISIWREANAGAAFARLFSVLCIAATIALVAPIAERYAPRAGPRWICLTAAINPFLIWAALEIRPYALIILLSALLLFFFEEAFLHTSPRRSMPALYALCVLCALYTQYYLAFLIAAQGAYLTLFRRRALPAFLLCGAVAALAFLPLLATLPGQVQNFQGGFAPPHSLLDPARALAGSIVRYVLPLDFLPHASALYALLIAFGFAGVVFAVASRRVERHGDGAIIAITAFAVAAFDAGLFAAKVHFLNRHGASLAVPAMLSVAAAFTYLRPAWRRISLTCWYATVAAASIATLGTTYAAGAKAGDWERVASYIESREAPGEPIAVFQAENALPFAYYYHGSNRIYAIPHAVDFKRYDVTKFIVRNQNDIERVLPRNAKRVWWINAGECMSANLAFGCDVVERYISTHYQVLERAHFYKSDIRFLALRPAGSALTPHFQSCPVFTPNDYYNRDVTHEAIDPHSADYIRSMIAAGNTGDFWAAAKPVEYINTSSAATPLVDVRQKVRYHAFAERFPWSSDFRIEPLSDAHAIVIAPATCRLYESYDTSFADGVLSAYSGAVWDLRKPFAPLPAGTPSSMASGLSLFAGMLKWEEVRDGSVLHALNWAAVAGTASQYGFVRPASDTDSLPFKGSGSFEMPYGAHLRLKASFDTTGFGPQSLAIVTALKTYGMYLADTGSDDNALYTAMPLDGRAHWDAHDLASLSRIHVSDFDVLPLGPVQRVPGH